MSLNITHKQLTHILPIYKRLSLLNKINATLGWDQNVNLPAKAAGGRAEQIAYLTELTADEWLKPSFRSALESLDATKGTPEEKAMIRNLKHAGTYYHRVPKSLIVEKSKVTAEAFMAWQTARRDNTFSTFLPHLSAIIDINRRIAAEIGFKDNPYDVHLNLHEPGLTAAHCAGVFGALQPQLTELIGKIKASDRYRKTHRRSETATKYDQTYQKQFAEFILHVMGYDFQAGRMDISPHPFTTTMDQYDVRITTRYNEYDYRECYTSAVHEGGHALYEQGINPDYDYTPLEGGVSMGIHESQSRFWENMVGRNPEFLGYLLPHFRNHFPKSPITDVESLTMSLNEVEPGLIRTQADEVTYNLHIILRFQLEDALMNNRIDAADLPGEWNRLMKEFLGVEPETDRDGVLQDVHWSYGEFGYFPTYALGNLYSAQIFGAIGKAMDLNDALRSGRLADIHGWLKEQIYQHGALYWPDELIKRVTGKALDPQDFVTYLTAKYALIYQL